MPQALRLDHLQSVPIFALPSVVLFPRAILPLHIFEERYKTMTDHALAGNHLIAMALLKPGWEKDYYSRPAIEPVVCIGQIISHERLADGKYNFLLEGIARATIVCEVGKESYRQAQLRLLEQTAAPPETLEALRERISRLLDDGPLSRLPAARPFRQILDSDMPTSAVADLLAFSFLEDVQLKQSLLADTDVQRRVERAVDAMQKIEPQPEMIYSLSNISQTHSMN
jgi:Lon protease-like protein